ncbi:cytochrome P450 [Mesobacterium pallidum]|uniref:cytochrome P450 n=1 Tax=Mesobacterium pallidum TaxID=2872037 RepID=UPI001EE2BEE5|nr:cytochrome P450 [Mesobacterium pallidum]
MKRLRKWFGAGPTPEPAIDLAQPVDLLGAGFLADPYPTWAALRARLPLAPVAGGGYILTRHADIKAAFSDDSLGNAPSRFSVLAPRNREKYAAADLAAHIPPFLDMPGHRLPRQALTRAFFNTFKPFATQVEEEAEAILAAAPRDGAFDLIETVSSPFSVRVMARFVGLDADVATLKAATQAFFHLFAPIRDPAAFAETNAQLAAVRALVADQLAARRADGRPCLLTHLAAFQQDAPDLTDAQIVDNAILVFADGVENIEAGAATLLRLVAREGIGQQVASGALDAEAVVREGLRLDSPGQVIPRVARADTTLHDTPIPAGTPVFLALAAANRDPDAFDDPDVFRPGRAGDPVIFGQGRHRCIGEQLGVLQLRVLLTAMLRSGLSDAAPGSPLGYQPRFGHRWPKAMAVTFG